MSHVIEWPTNVESAKRRLQRRLKAAKEARSRLVEAQWKRNERYIYRNDEILAQRIAPFGVGGGGGTDTDDFDDPEMVEISYVFKDLRFLHAQLSSNPPVAKAIPLSSDQAAVVAARGADQCMRWMLRRYELQEVYDLVGLDCLVYGIGIAETLFDHELGEIEDFDEETGELRMSGDLYAGRVSPWDFFPDPSATSRLNLRWAFKRFRVTHDEFLSRWPHLRSLLAGRVKGGDGSAISLVGSPNGTTDRSALDLPDDCKDEVELVEYWEAGAPENGMVGRYAVLFFDDCTIIEPPRPSPLSLPAPLSLEERKEMAETGRSPRRRRPSRAPLPFHIWTDVDVPGRLWGKSFLEYAGPNQELMNNLDSALLELVKVHGIFRLILPPGAQLEEGQLDNDPARVYRLKSTGTVEGSDIKAIPPSGVPGSMAELRSLVRLGIDDMAGVNENMFGQQSREQSGWAMQYAVNQGHMIRRRLFNKAVAFTESLYTLMLRLACYHWDEPQMIEVLGEEHAYDLIELRGVDFDGGYRIQTEYGTSLPLDPVLRRDEILKYMPLLEKAQVPPKMILSALRLADFDKVRDVADLAEDRAREIVDEIVATRLQVEPRRHQDHVGIIAWLKYYVNTAQFKHLPEEAQRLIEDHIDERARFAAQETQPAAGAGAPGGAPLGGVGAAPQFAPPAAGPAEGATGAMGAPPL